MKRILLDKLKQWKNSATRQSLILRGVCQVSKTWLMKEFAIILPKVQSNNCNPDIAIRLQERSPAHECVTLRKRLLF